VDSFCVLLERHIRTEERQLFVLAENRMKPAEMAELRRQIKRSLGEERSLALVRGQKGERVHQRENAGPGKPGPIAQNSSSTGWLRESRTKLHFRAK
jgi:hypothetical protein